MSSFCSALRPEWDQIKSNDPCLVIKNLLPTSTQTFRNLVNNFQLITMKLGGKVLALFSCFRIFFFVNCADYKFLKIFNCSSDKEIFDFETCTNSPTEINVTYIVKKSVNKIDVSDERWFRKTLSFFFSLDWFCFISEERLKLSAAFQGPSFRVVRLTGWRKEFKLFHSFNRCSSQGNFAASDSRLPLSWSLRACEC